jgi:hypothetical protein
VSMPDILDTVLAEVSEMPSCWHLFSRHYFVPVVRLLVVVFLKGDRGGRRTGR